MPFDTRDKHPIDNQTSYPAMTCLTDMGVAIAGAAFLTLGMTDKLDEPPAITPIGFGILCALFRTGIAIRSTIKGFGLFNTELYVFDRLRCKSEQQAANGLVPATQALLPDSPSTQIDMEHDCIDLQAMDYQGNYLNGP